MDRPVVAKDNEEIKGFAFDYAYDPIGNRTTSATYNNKVTGKL